MRHKLIFGVVILVLQISSAHGQNPCTASGLKGKFVYTAYGLVTERLQSGLRYDPIAEIGIADYDGNGNVSVRREVHYHGTGSTVAAKGTYTVNADCIGAASFKDQDGTEAARWNFAISAGGQEIETLYLRSAVGNRPQYALTFMQKKQ